MAGPTSVATFMVPIHAHQEPSSPVGGGPREILTATVILVTTWTATHPIAVVVGAALRVPAPTPVLTVHANATTTIVVSEKPVVHSSDMGSATTTSPVSGRLSAG